VAGWKWIILSDQWTVRAYSGCDAWKRNALLWSDSGRHATAETSPQPGFNAPESRRHDSAPGPGASSTVVAANYRSLQAPSASSSRTTDGVAMSRTYSEVPPAQSTSTSRTPSRSNRVNSPTIAESRQSHDSAPRGSVPRSRADSSSEVPSRPSSSNRARTSVGDRRKSDIAKLAAALQLHAQASAELFKSVQDQIRVLQDEGGGDDDDLEELAQLASRTPPLSPPRGLDRGTRAQNLVPDRANERTSASARDDVVVIDNISVGNTDDERERRSRSTRDRDSQVSRAPQTLDFRVTASTSVTHGCSGKTNPIRFLFDIPEVQSYFGLTMHGNIVGWSQRVHERVFPVLGPVHPNSALYTDAAAYSTETNTLVVALYPPPSAPDGSSSTGQVALVRPSSSRVCLQEIKRRSTFNQVYIGRRRPSRTYTALPFGT
jgi:hypothetical protein